MQHHHHGGHHHGHHHHHHRHDDTPADIGGRKTVRLSPSLVRLGIVARCAIALTLISAIWLTTWSVIA